MVGSKSKVKSFEIDKRLVHEAWMKVQANGGAPGEDAVSIDGFREAERDNLYKLWNRMSSGSYLPGPVRAVEIPKDHGAGIRVLGVPNVADRIAQTAAAMLLEEKLEPIFHPDSYGYRPGRSAHDAVAVTRRRCWKQDWVLDLDVRSFLGGWGLDTQAFSASGAHVHGFELAALDTLHDGLAGYAVGEGGLQHGEPAVGGIVDHGERLSFGRIVG